MKWLRLIGLHFERTFEYRLKSLLWLLIPISNNITLILFWSGTGVNMSYISTYYVLMTIGGLLLTSHVEYEVAEYDIKQGQLVNYLTKPISYYWINFIGELPFRVLQSFYAILIIGVFMIFFRGSLAITLNPWHIPLVMLIFILGYSLSFTFKLSSAYLSFWFTEIRGIYELITILFIVLSGSVMPLEWYPPIIQKITHILPFAYSAYFPVIALQGSVPLKGLLSIIASQGVWLIILVIIHNKMWKEGIKQFTAVGQ
ncbi:MAG: ABC-2 family transporter protein [bacterium]